MAYKLLGKDFPTPDGFAKVTGQAKYAEDYRAEGMLFVKLFLSPVPHGRVRRIDAREALAMDGVVAILTPDDVPAPAPPAEPILAREPLFVGDPIAAVAAVDEATAAEAVERLKVDIEPLPFVLNPLDTLRPGSPNPRSDGNVPVGVAGAEGTSAAVKVGVVKWTARDFAAAGDGQLPLGKPTVEWSYGDLEAGFAAAALVLDETVVTQNLPANPQEPRSTLAYWQNGKLFVYGTSQSYSLTVLGIADLVGVKPTDVVLVNMYCGGGFGSKSAAYRTMAIPALLAKKTGRPVMLRPSRAEEFYYGNGRMGFQLRAKIGFRADGRITAMDLFIVGDAGAYTGDALRGINMALEAASINYQPLAMRGRGIGVFTNTPKRWPMRGPGPTQIVVALEPLMDKAARQLGIDRVALRRVNAPGNDGKAGAQRIALTSAYAKDALDQGAALFGWEEKKKLSGRKNGTRVTGVGVALSVMPTAAQSGFDGLLIIKPDGKVQIHQGMGNLGTFSYAGTARVAAEVLGVPWEKVEVLWGRTENHLPWNFGQFGSNSTYTEGRTNYAAAMDARRKLQEIAAREFGGQPDDYDVGGEKVFRKANPRQFLTLAQAAQRAIALGGKYSGQELPPNLNPMTVAAAKALAGQGLMGVAKNTQPVGGVVPAFTAGFARVEVDTETGKVTLVEYAAVNDCGTVVHPQSLHAQTRGGGVQGFGIAMTESYLYDRQFGIPLNTDFLLNKPPTFLDVPLEEMTVDAVNKPDSSGAFGTKGIGEPPVGAGAAAVVCAICDALGGKYFNRTPITADMILNVIEGKPLPFGPFDVNVEV